MKVKKIFFISILLNILLLFYVGKIIHQKGGIEYLKWKLKLGDKPVKSHNNDYYEIKKSVYEIMPNTSNTIVFLGDSMTEYCNWNELFENPNIINRGISGDIIQGVIGRIDDIIEIKPKQLFIMMGVNDLQQYESVQKVLTNYENLLTQIIQKTPQTEILVQSILPTDNREKLKNKDIIEINIGLSDFSKKNNLTFINLFDQFKNNENKLKPTLTVDGVHLNGNGYLVWKKAIQKYLEKK